MTIVAIATPPGNGGIAIIRLSGKSAVEIAEKVFSRSLKDVTSHTAVFGKILTKDGEVIDEGLALVFLGDKSFTGEDTVELQCHGGSLISKQVLHRVIEAGAKMAGPGEFSFRAFKNGKLDLAQAEAIQRLIGAKNSLALKASSQQLAGFLSKKVQTFQKELFDQAAILEAAVDFPEEDLAFTTTESMIESLKNTRQKILDFSATFHEGKMLHDGLHLCLSGTPNVGKSSLMNALLRQDRAIVTEIAGTTRDLLQEDLRLSDLHFKLTDTAGLRTTDERVEKEGIARSKKAMDEADLILLVMDASRPLTEEDTHLLASAPKDKTLLIWNKIDLPHEIYPSPLDHVLLSAKTGEGIDALKKAIEQKIWKKGPPNKEEIVLTEQRHREALDLAAASLSTVIEGLSSGVSPEFLSSDMRAALSSLSQIIGTDISEEILSAIFSKFCVGK